MPPKKSTSKTSVTPKIAKEKVPKPRIRKEKPKLKTPSLVKVKLSFPGIGQKDSPTKKNAVDIVNSELPQVKPATKREMMMDRINEVARAQLVKGSPVNIETVIPEKKKKGRKKKIKPETVPEVPKDSQENIGDEVVVKKKRVWKKKTKPEADTVPDDSGGVIPRDKPVESPEDKPTINSRMKKTKERRNLKRKRNSTKPLLSRQNTMSEINKAVRKSTREIPTKILSRFLQESVTCFVF